MRDDRAVAFELRFAEDERQHGHEEVDGRHSKDSAGPLAKGEQVLQHLGGVVLIAAGIEGEGWIQTVLVDQAGQAEDVLEMRGQPLEQAGVGGLSTDDDQMYRRACRCQC